MKSGETVTEFALNVYLTPPTELNILLKDNALEQMLDIISVPDKHICLFYENGNFQYVLQPGRYPFWKMGTERNTVMIDISKIEISDDIPKNLFGNAKLLPFLRSFTVPAHHKGILCTWTENIRKF